MEAGSQRPDSDCQLLTSTTAALLGRIQHRDHCRANHLGQSRPGTHNPQQLRIIGGHFGANCTGFCSARFENPRIPAGRRPRFESPILHSTGLYHLAPGRRPLQNGGFFMRGQSGLRPRARQCGRLPEDRSSVQRLFSRARLRTVTHPLDWKESRRKLTVQRVTFIVRVRSTGNEL